MWAKRHDDRLAHQQEVGVVRLAHGQQLARGTGHTAPLLSAAPRRAGRTGLALRRARGLALGASGRIVALAPPHLTGAVVACGRAFPQRLPPLSALIGRRPFGALPLAVRLRAAAGRASPGAPLGGTCGPSACSASGSAASFFRRPPRRSPASTALGDPRVICAMGRASGIRTDAARAGGFRGRTHARPRRLFFRRRSARSVELAVAALALEDLRLVRGRARRPHPRMIAHSVRHRRAMLALLLFLSCASMPSSTSPPTLVLPLRLLSPLLRRLAQPIPPIVEPLCVWGPLLNMCVCLAQHACASLGLLWHRGIGKNQRRRQPSSSSVSPSNRRAASLALARHGRRLPVVLRDGGARASSASRVVRVTRLAMGTARGANA